ncbi:MAG: hypothetical protein ACYCT1_07230 [Steroidobacteraceae bacterium]
MTPERRAVAAQQRGEPPVLAIQVIEEIDRSGFGGERRVVHDP